MQKRISPSAKEFFWYYNKADLSVADEEELKQIMEDAGFFVVTLNEEQCAFINLDSWDQSNPVITKGGLPGLGGALSGLSKLGWYPHNSEVQFNARGYADKHKHELQWLLNWVEFRINKDTADAISPFGK